MLHLYCRVAGFTNQSNGFRASSQATTPEFSNFKDGWIPAIAGVTPDEGPNSSANLGDMTLASDC